MRLTIDPMPAARQAQKDRVNAAFNAVSQSHVEMAHAQKRLWAETEDEKLKPEADLRGVSVSELASLILSKPDRLAERELERQKIMAAIEAARTIEDLERLSVGDILND